MPAIQGVNELTLPAAADLSSEKHRAGVINTSGQVAVAGAGVLPKVIIMSTPDTAGLATNCHHIASSIRVVVQLGATVAIGDELTTDASGDFIDGTSGDLVCLTALEAGASGELIEALVGPSDTVA